MSAAAFGRLGRSDTQKRIGDSVYEYQRLDPDLYVDGRIDRTNETFRTPRNQKVYTIIALQCEYIRINPLKDKLSAR